MDPWEHYRLYGQAEGRNLGFEPTGTVYQQGDFVSGGGGLSNDLWKLIGGSGQPNPTLPNGGQPSGGQVISQPTPQQVSPQSSPQTSQPSANLGMSQFTANPWQKEMFDSVTNQVTDNLNRNILPGLRSASTATGGYGGSRQGVVEANALKDANQGLSNTLAGIQYGDWNNFQNRLLQNKGLDQSFYTAQRGQDLQQTGLGSSIFNMGTQGMLGQGQGIYNLGLTAQQAPWQTLTGFNNVSSPYTGYGSTSGTQAGSPLANAAGGAMLGGQMYQAWKGNAGTPSTGANMSYAPGMQPTNVMSYF